MELSTKKRSTTSIEVAENITEMFYDKPVPEWAEVLDTMDVPDYFLTFSAFVATNFCLILPFEYAAPLVTALAKLIVSSADANFIIVHYLPRMGLAIKDLTLTKDQKTDIAKKFGGTLIKIIWAFVW